eukprot:Hpha_TRINITY_DN32986_c0_g1::TRINITY_DN32986_c0_g1_i1::g.113262::m.113262
MPEPAAGLPTLGSNWHRRLGETPRVEPRHAVLPGPAKEDDWALKSLRSPIGPKVEGRPVWRSTAPKSKCFSSPISDSVAAQLSPSQRRALQDPIAACVLGHRRPTKSPGKSGTRRIDKGKGEVRRKGGVKQENNERAPGMFSASP